MGARGDGIGRRCHRIIGTSALHPRRQSADDTIVLRVLTPCRRLNPPCQPLSSPFGILGRRRSPTCLQLVEADAWASFWQRRLSYKPFSAIDHWSL